MTLSCLFVRLYLENESLKSAYEQTMQIYEKQVQYLRRMAEEREISEKRYEMLSGEIYFRISSDSQTFLCAVLFCEADASEEGSATE
jgi:hypothetical protein